MMWKKMKIPVNTPGDRITYTKNGRIELPAALVKRMGLNKYRGVDFLENDHSKMIGLQFKNEDFQRKLIVRRNVVIINARFLSSWVPIGRYFVQADKKGFIIINFERPIKET